MYYDFEVPLPDAPGKLAYEKHGDTTYVKYEYDRINKFLNLKIQEVI